MATTSQVLARRIGRITFGAVLLIGVGWLLSAAWAELVHESRRPEPLLNAAQILEMTWPIAALAGVVAWRVALRLRLSAHPDAMLPASLVIPMVAIALLAPLTLHLPVVLALADRETFDMWVMLSLCITGLAHVVFAFTSARRGYHLATGKPAWSPLKVYAATVITSCVPFVLLYAIPPVLVAITALPLLPVLYAMERIVTRERAELAGAPHALPRAIAAISRRAP
jgi:hypothetical protein